MLKEIIHNGSSKESYSFHHERYHSPGGRIKHIDLGHGCAWLLNSDHKIRLALIIPAIPPLTLRSPKDLPCL